MKPSQIEYWIHGIIDRINSNKPIEDTRIELKAEWIEPQKAARQLAGHANASRGEPILWIIGVDEQKGLLGANREELANWLPSVQSQFDGIYPEILDLIVPVDKFIVVALYIETNRAPFVIKNPLFGKNQGENISLEVPWREGTRTRTATRSDLIKLLVPIIKLPELEVISCNLYVSPTTDNLLHWSIDLEVYITPQIGYPCVIPFHRSSITFTFENTQDYFEMEYVRIISPYKKFIRDGGYTSDPSLDNTKYEAIINRPGLLNIEGGLEIFCQEPNFVGSDTVVKIKLGLAYTEDIISLEITLKWSIPVSGRVGQWTILE